MYLLTIYSSINLFIHLSILYQLIFDVFVHLSSIYSSFHLNLSINLFLILSIYQSFSNSFYLSTHLSLSSSIASSSVFLSVSSVFLFSIFRSKPSASISQLSMSFGGKNLPECNSLIIYGFWRKKNSQNLIHNNLRLGEIFNLSFRGENS